MNIEETKSVFYTWFDDGDVWFDEDGILLTKNREGIKGVLKMSRFNNVRYLKLGLND